MGGRLARCHEFESAPVRAWDSTECWFRQQAPALLDNQLPQHLERLRGMAAAVGFVEMPTEVDLLNAVRQGPFRRHVVGMN